MAREMEGHTIVDVLRSSHAFGDLEPRHLEQLATFAAEVTWPADHLIFREGEPDEKLYVLLDGLVALDTYVPNRGRVTIQTLGPGDILGWSAAVPQVQKKTASARSLLATHAVAIDAAALHAACEQDHDLGFHVYRALAVVIASRLKATRLQLLDIFAIGERR
ncbi:MAG: cyclic nucleotide-binding domain-containing protein [Armatimonadota bacterium]|nr:cyclic nucleotide-binding domain-containing protein [Armatimonadota bacterium]